MQVISKDETERTKRRPSITGVSVTKVLYAMKQNDRTFIDMRRET